MDIENLNISGQTREQEKIKNMEDEFEELLRNGPRSENIIVSSATSGSSVRFELADEYQNMLVVIGGIRTKTRTISLAKNGMMIGAQHQIEAGFGEGWNRLASSVIHECSSGIRGI